MAIKSSNQITFTEQKRIIEIKEWYLATSLEEDVTTETEGWTTSVQKTDADNRYLWNYEEVVYSIGESEKSLPVIIGVYGSVKDIVNYYGVTEGPQLPDPIPGTFWKTDFADVGPLSNINKYLWNYEVIIYADGTPRPSPPAIIGVYGDSGEDAVSFKIYSTDGFEFIESAEELEKLDTINLKLSTFKGSQPLDGAIYTWSWWNSALNDGAGDYENIEGYVNTTEPLLSVHINDVYAFANLRCTMTYDGNPGEPYEDYIILSKKRDAYTANVKFFEGTNVFSQGQEYMIAYIELCKNNFIEEGTRTSVYYTGEATLDLAEDGVTQIIETDYVWYEGAIEEDEVLPIDTETEEATDDRLVYFVCSDKNENRQVVLGRYDHTNSRWVVEKNELKYIYQNDMDTDNTSNIFLVYKSDITRSKNININVYRKSEKFDLTDDIDEDFFIASTFVTVIDLNDTTVSGTAPEYPYEGQLWFDTKEGILKIYDSINNVWTNSSLQQSGKNVYTSKPTSYKTGDLWIVEDGPSVIKYVTTEVESTTEGEYWILQDGVYISKILPNEYDKDASYYIMIKYDAGAVLIATVDSNEFSSYHWEDSAPKLTAMQSNINQHFNFDPKTGLKIGQIDQKFYVNISATRMSFCEDTLIETNATDEYIDPNEVVYIGNKSATIRELIVNGTTTFKDTATFEKDIYFSDVFTLMLDDTGLSLVLKS